MYLIKNAKILTMAEKDYEQGDILIEDGVIKSIGECVEAPADCEVYDAKGMWALPGFVEAHCHAGVYEEKIGWEGLDGNEIVNPIAPQLRALDAINPEDPALKEAYEHGITTVCTGPGSANVIGGQFVAMKTYGRRVDDMIIKEPLAVKAALGENPKRCYGNMKKSPSTRMATASLLRQALIDAQEYKKKIDTADVDDKAKAPQRDLGKEMLVDVIDGKVDMKIHCHRADDILTAIRVAKEFEIPFTLEHCSDGWRIIDILEKENVRAILGPYMGTRKKIEVKDKTFKAPKVFSDHGVKFALMTDHPVNPLHYLPLCAALSVREGLDQMEALKAITIYPAEITGIDDRVGSLEVGKDADISLFEDNPLYVTTRTKLVMINGNIVHRA